MARGGKPKFTREQLIEALRQADYDLMKAAVLLGVNLSTVYRAMARYDVKVETTKVVAA